MDVSEGLLVVVVGFIHPFIPKQVEKEIVRKKRINTKCYSYVILLEIPLSRPFGQKYVKSGA